MGMLLLLLVSVYVALNLLRYLWVFPLLCAVRRLCTYVRVLVVALAFVAWLWWEPLQQDAMEAFLDACHSFATVRVEEGEMP